MQLLLLDRGDGDNTIYLDEARECVSKGPTLILLPVRLGMHTIDRSYLPKVEHVFRLPQSVGFIGGRPVSACAYGAMFCACERVSMSFCLPISRCPRESRQQASFGRLGLFCGPSSHKPVNGCWWLTICELVGGTARRHRRTIS
jgi:hypothetical protein